MTVLRVALACAAAVGACATPPRPAAAPEPGQVTTVILVRHAEKVDESRDPELSAAGRERARLLARALADVPLDAVLSTPFIRTRETARPVADTHGLPIIETPVVANYSTSVAERVLEAHRGQTVLVVGHSNTTPDVIRALGVPSVPDLSDPEYDDLFIVIIPAAGGARLVQLHYGAETP